MGEYVAAYGERSALIVAAERYTQRVSSEAGLPFPPRQLLAEFAIVKVPGLVGWIGFRDVVEVDGESVTDRRERLLRLLSDQNGDVGEARRISNESARFNVGPVSRNFNVPTTTLFFFHPANLPRFTFKAKGRKTIDGVDTWAIEFKERRRPSMVMTREGKDVPSEGTVWVSPADGTIVRTLVTFRGFADDRVLQAATVGQNVRPGGVEGPPPAVAPPRPSRPSQPQPPTQAPAAPSPPAASGQRAAGAFSASGADSVAPSRPQERGGPEPQELLRGDFGSRRLESLARIEVTYKRHDQFGMWLPSRMSELYEGPIPRGTRPPFLGQAMTTAEYSDFKQFTTSAKVVAPK